MGVGTRSKAWRFTDLNKDYNVSLFMTFYVLAPESIYCDSSAQLTLQDWLYRRELVTPPFSMLQSTGVNAEYRC